MYVNNNTRTGRDYFVRNTARTESDVLAKKVVVPKDKRGIHGSIERGIHYLVATGALDPTLSEAGHFLLTCREGGPDNQYHNIQEMYVGNLLKLRKVREWCVKYNMVDALKFPNIIDVASTDPHSDGGG